MRVSTIRTRPDQSASSSSGRLPRLVALICLALGGVLFLGSRTLASLSYAPFGSTCGVQVATESVSFGNGASAVDFDNDGDLDLYLTDGAARSNRMFLNDGSFGFTEVSNALTATNAVESQIAVFADYDNDGDKDVFITYWGAANKLFRNDGSFSYVDVTATAGVGGGALYTEGAAWGDVDRDGLLDLFVANRGLTTAGEPNQFYRNLGNGSFANLSAAMDLNESQMSFQAVFLDYDQDGDSDIYVATDKFQGNRLYRNNWPGPFDDVSTASGAGLLMDGMGIGVGDINADGYPDLYITNTPTGNRCLESNGDGTFREVSGDYGIEVNSIGWGALFIDADLDGDEDLYTVNAAPFPNRLFRNDGATWSNQSVAAGIEGAGMSFGALAADFDADGDLDLYASNVTQLCEVYRNDSPAQGNWLIVRPEGTVSNRDGIGARVEIEVGGVAQFREIRAGSSYLSQMAGWAHFGLGPATTVDRLTIEWPSGIIDEWTGLSSDQVFDAQEGGSTSTPLVASISEVNVSPNPFLETVGISFEIPRTGPANLRVIDVRGRAVRTQTLGTLSQGAAQVTWDRRDDQGRRVPAGVYWLEIRSGSARISAQAVALR